MSDFTIVSDEDLARARKDPTFRYQLISDNLKVLLVGLHKLRSQAQSPEKDKEKDRKVARQIREGVDMAVRLAELLQTAKRDSERSHAA